MTPSAPSFEMAHLKRIITHMGFPPSILAPPSVSVPPTAAPLFSTTAMNPSQSGPRVQRGFEPEKSGFIVPREQSPYLAATLRYITALNAMNFDTITEVFDPSLRHITWPTSLKKPRLTYDQYFKYLDSWTDMLAELHIQIFDIVEQHEKMTVQLLATGKGRSGQAYFNETVLLIKFHPFNPKDEKKYGSNASNWPPEMLPKMIEVTEFVDSEHTKSFFMAETQWMRNKDAVAQQQLDEKNRGRGWIKTRWKQRQTSKPISPTITHGVMPGQPTQFNSSPTTGTSYQYAYPPTFPPGGFSISRSYGQGQGAPTSPMTSHQTPTSFGTSAQSYSRSGQGHSSYRPPSMDKYSGN